MTVATQLSKQFDCPFVSRERYSLNDLYLRMEMSEVLIVAKNGLRYQNQDGDSFAFHPNMSALRIKHLQNGKKDPIVECSEMAAGDEVLDCTLGMGADAIVASYVVGEKGKVVALESQPVIAAIVKEGLKSYETDRKALKRVMRAIEVVQTDYRSYLPRLPDRSFDIVMFDPMFRKTIKESTAMQQLRPLANPDPVDPQSIREAVRVARKAVLLKERKGSAEFERLGFPIVKAFSSYAWGIWKKEGI